MGAARKRKTEPGTTSKVTDFLNPKKIGEKKSSSVKEKPVSHFPTDAFSGSTSLSEKMDQFAAAHAVANAAVRKSSELKSEIKSFLLQKFAEKWAYNRGRPKSRTWKAFRSSLDHVVTRKITIDLSKQEAIKDELDIDLVEHLTIPSFKINVENLKKKKEYFNAFVAFLGKLSEEDLISDEYVVRSFALDPEFFGKIGEICNYDEDKIHRLLKILNPQVNLTNVDSSNMEEDQFDFVRNMRG